MILLLDRMPEKKSTQWLVVTAILFVIYLASLWGSRLILGMGVTAQTIQGFSILAAMMSLAVVTGGYFGAKIYSITALIFSGIAILHLVGVSALNPASGWSDLIGVIGFMFWGGMAIGMGIIVQLIYSIRASKKQIQEVVEEEKQVQIQLQNLSTEEARSVQSESESEENNPPQG
jgi:hypothetical protein